MHDRDLRYLKLIMCQQLSESIPSPRYLPTGR
jgi:hypothetical protein